MDSAKDRFGLALKEELKTKPLNKVTVSRLAEGAGLGRQSFYYHFADVYDLVTWVFERDVAEKIMSCASYDRWAEGFEQLLQYMRMHREEVNAVMRSLSHRELETFFYRQFRQMMEAVVSQLQDGLTIKEEERQLVVTHYAIAVVGHLLHWLATDMAQDPQVLTARLQTVMRGNVRQTLERFAETN